MYKKTEDNLHKFEKQDKFLFLNLFALDKTFKMEKKYQEMIENRDLQIKKFDFQSDSAKTTEKLNKIVEEKTCGKIQNLFEQDLGSDTRFVLLNVLYFKSPWLDEFGRIGKSDFKLANGNIKKVPFMKLSDSEGIKYFQKDDFSIVQIPFKSNENSFYLTILVPDNDDADIKNYISNMRYIASTWFARVDIRMPLFKFAQTHKLKKILQKMGLTELLGNNPDLSEICCEKIKIDKFVQKATIAIDEKGGEAAAATRKRIVFSCITRVISLNITRPFIFTIREHQTATDLFTGIVYDP